MQRYFYLPFLSLLLLTACGPSTALEVQGFDPLANFSAVTDTLDLPLRLDGAVRQGIQIPERGNPAGDFLEVTFQVKNNGTDPRGFHYQVYYQNEAYAFPAGHPRAGENFYGSISGPGQGFRQTPPIPADGEFHAVRDTLRILGNPRGEELYFGPEEWRPSEVEERVTNQLNYMRTLEGDWVTDMRKKARENGRTLAAQMEADARWAVQERQKKTMVNHRERRNPRMGAYSFRLVVMDDTSLARVPGHIQDIARTGPSGQFENPYGYFTHDTLAGGAAVVTAARSIRPRAIFAPENGIFLHPDDLATRPYDTTRFQSGVGISDRYFTEAHFKQFFHYTDPHLNPRNVALARDITSGGFDADAYDALRAEREEADLPAGEIGATKAPGTTLGYDAAEDALFFFNPGQARPPYRKEHVGVQGRIGLSYGRYRARIRFPEITHIDHHVWNGLTCAFWLIYETDEPWGQNQDCQGGYIPKTAEDSSRVLTNNYSEIDIEIVKSSPYWPITSYEHSPWLPPADHDARDNNLIVSCTNWDLACPDPDTFTVGAMPGTPYAGDTFTLHRWNHWYRALTIKTERPREQVVGAEIVYEIDWQPERIIWRMGPDPDHLEVIGYMDAAHTVIPSNQMQPVITQEFHLANWWPMAPFHQAFVPYPAEDLRGYLYAMEVL